MAVGNMLHPRSQGIEVYAEQIKAVSESDFWISDRLLLFVGALLIAVFLLAPHRTMLDGLASKATRDAWASATNAEQDVSLRVAEAIEEIDVGVFSLWIILFSAATFIVYGLAVAMSDNFPKWLGWAATVLMRRKTMAK